MCVVGGGSGAGVRPGWQGQGEAENTELRGPASGSARGLIPCMFPVLKLWIRPALKSILKTFPADFLIHLKIFAKLIFLVFVILNFVVNLFT